MKRPKKSKTATKYEHKDEQAVPRNPPLHIPLDFEQAVDALLKTKPKKKRPSK
jgi:hypothetical protein